MDTELQGELIAYLAQFVTRNKREKIDQVLENRTTFITLVLEDIYQSQNASATLRTCEGLGLQTIHIIENRNPYKINPDVTQGATKWLTLKQYNQIDQDNTTRCLLALKEEGYRLVATSPSHAGIDLESLAIDCKTAFMFGNEKDGLSPTALALADVRLRLPMFGFTRSYNITVSVAMTLGFVMERLHRSAHFWQLTEDEKRMLKLEWYRKIVDRSDVLEKVYLKNKGL